MVVAVKVFKLVDDPRASKSFKSECEALRNIRHRNLVKILTACSSIDHQGNEFKALVYEFMENGNLEEWLHLKGRERKLCFLQRLNIAIDVACAVDYLHHDCETPIIHCDLKPSNVLLDADMTAHVGDFGLSRFVLQQRSDSSNSQTLSVGVRGSVGYAAPEYGMGSRMSTQGDVYSYGILLLEMFTGRRPTDEMFKDNLSLHSFAEMALPERVEEIADPILLEHEREEKESAVVEASKNAMDQCNDNNVSRKTIEECLVSVFRIGVACSVELPRERLDMGDVVAKLQWIKNSLIGGREVHSHMHHESAKEN
ncbi:receptor kinase-like protein Xa21 [Rhododendron vialii]|uniref:receptor kinase-like protein Xa21 n=1 Tax=Rhododendron vialii TaxID=182163 RepID=UPI00265F15DD|nr:receptor kinase-like protein Xa21 [Rhododendron vialii]